MADGHRTIGRLAALNAIKEIPRVVGSVRLAFPGARRHGHADSLVLLGILLALDRAEGRQLARANALGNDFDLADLRKAGGAGFRWQSPFGPIRVDYGVNLDRRPGEKFGALQFSVGTPF